MTSVPPSASPAPSSPPGCRPLPALPLTLEVAREFPILGRWTFFNHAGVSPLPARVAGAMEEYARTCRDDAYMTAGWHKRIEFFRATAAKLINAYSDEIAFIKNTSEGLSFVANGLEWNPGDEVISTAVEYPANVYPWMDLAQRRGIRHIMVPERREGGEGGNEGPGRIEMADLLAAVTPRTKMIALSHVEYASGFRNDLAAIGRFCRERGILLCVDAIQSCGVLPVDVRAMNIDFLSADGHKWMLGPEGAGIFYCRRELIPTVRPPEVGWLNVVDALNFSHYDFTLRTDARRFECGALNVPGLLAFAAAVDLILEIGIPTISERVLALTDRLCAGLAAKGYRVYSSRRPGEESGIVSFWSPAHDSAQLLSELEKKRIILVLRDGRLRASPHFYNTAEQIDHLLAALPG